MNVNLKCIAVDDESIALDILEGYLSKFEEVKLVEKFNNPLDAIRYLNENQVDVVFLDVNMPEFSGIDLIKTLKDKPYVVLCTANPSYAIDGYKLEVFDYLLKPFGFEALQQTINRIIDDFTHTQGLQDMALSSVNQGESFFFVKADGKYVKLNYNDIYYIEGLKEYVSIFLKSKRIVTLQAMKKLESILPINNFRRIHRSYIVNLNYMDAVNHNEVEINGKVLPIGKSYKDEFLEFVQSKNIS